MWIVVTKKHTKMTATIRALSEAEIQGLLHAAEANP
jgi:hypothetical protein